MEIRQKIQLMRKICSPTTVRQTPLLLSLSLLLCIFYFLCSHEAEAWIASTKCPHSTAKLTSPCQRRTKSTNSLRSSSRPFHPELQVESQTPVTIELLNSATPKEVLSSDVSSSTQTADSDQSTIDQQRQQQQPPQPFFIRPALMVDMSPASKILADAFFKKKTNFIIYHWERVNTWLSLESSFPKPNTYHQIFVACCSQRGTVWGMVEVDACFVGSSSNNNNSSSNNNNSSNSRPHHQAKDGPYMCNLAVDEQFQRLGIATALVHQCQRQVSEWHERDQQRCRRNNNNDDGADNDDDPTSTSTSSSKIRNSLCLRVRQSNEAAVQLYTKLGYRSVYQETEDKTGETVLLMRQQFECL